MDLPCTCAGECTANALLMDLPDMRQRVAPLVEDAKDALAQPRVTQCPDVCQDEGGLVERE